VDAYFKESNIAVEYDGEQHFKYIPFLHGSDENKFIRQTTLDEHKASILDSLGIKLIRFRFDEPFDIDFIKERVNEHTKSD
jgi:very-short-patch-repair endonuclease